MKSTLQEIKEKITHAQGMSKANKNELLGMVDKLYDELDTLATTDQEKADSVSKFAEVSTHEAARSEGGEKTLDYALKGFSSSVDELEVTHPKLVDIVNRICKMLSDIGI